MAGLAVASRAISPGEIASVSSLILGPDGRPIPYTPQSRLGFGAGRPVPPRIADSLEPRRDEYRPWINTALTPRLDEGLRYSFAGLRGLVQLCTYARLAVNYRKNQFRALRLEFTAREGVSKTAAFAEVQAAESFWAQPEPSKPSSTGRPRFGASFSNWIAAALEELLVTDGLVFYVVRDRMGRCVGLEQIDGATIKPVLNDAGSVVFYQQILFGTVAANYGPEDLVYLVYNSTVGSSYGSPPAEEIAPTVNIAIRRTVDHLARYTEGNVPSAFLEAPEGWTADEIAAAQVYLDETFSGNDAQRHKLRLIPHGSNYTQAFPFQFSKDEDESILTQVVQAYQVPRSTFVAQVNRACYSSDTETLTENGWKRFPDITEGERIATFNPVSGVIEYHAPVSSHVYPHSGEMVRFHTSSVDVLVTPEHKMWLRRPNRRRKSEMKDVYANWYRKLEAKDIPEGQSYFLAAAKGFDAPEEPSFSLAANGRSKKVTLLMDDWLELLGYYLSEGGLSHRPNHYLFTLAQKAGRKADKIQAVLDRVPFKSSLYPNLDEGIQRWNVYGKQVCAWLMAEAGGRCQNKRVPRRFMNLGPRQLRILFDALMLGDGTVDVRENRTAMAYHTTSRALADDVQEIAFKLGYSASVTTHYEANGNRMEAYRVLICERKEFSVCNGAKERTPNSVTREAYDGYVYCFEVPNHLFVTRRNGKIGIHGNTAESNAAESIDSGRIPLEIWWAAFINWVTRELLGLKNVRAGFTGGSTANVKDEAEADVALAGGPIYTVNERRAMRGLDPLPGGDKLAGATEAKPGDTGGVNGRVAANVPGDGAEGSVDAAGGVGAQADAAGDQGGATDSAGAAPIEATQAAREELATWRRFALKPERVRKGRWADAFETRVLDPVVADDVRSGLVGARTAADVSRVFDRAPAFAVGGGVELS